MRNVFDDADLDPALRLPPSGCRQRQVVAVHAVESIGAHEPPERNLDHAEDVLTLRSIPTAQPKTARDEFAAVFLGASPVGLLCHARSSASCGPVSITLQGGRQHWRKNESPLRLKGHSIGEGHRLAPLGAEGRAPLADICSAPQPPPVETLPELPGRKEPSFRGKGHGA